MSMSSDESVKVAARIRPLVETESNKGYRSIVSKTAGQQQIVVKDGSKTSKMWTYNYVFAPEDTQEMLYENAVKSMVLKLFEGYNVTILAYGQTGSGKTHTMGTTFNGIVDEEMGVIPRSVNDIFDQILSMPEYDFVVSCSFVELYQEKLYDLLSSNPREQSIVDIREVDSKIVVPNLTEKNVSTTTDTIKCLMEASSDRAVAATAMNAQSSRSHAIFTITVQKVPKNDPASATVAKFHLVDLAGSERSKKTQADGERFKEGVKINMGLLALGNVISVLGTGNSNNGHVPYRDSKLTRLLQDSLGGNSMTLMIACVSPADYNYDETINTLQYADRAKKIKNKPIVNEDPKMAEINRLKAELDTLRLEILSKTGPIEKCKNCNEPPTKIQLQKENREMAEKMQVALFEMAHRENILTEYEETIESLNSKIDGLKQQITDLSKVNTENMSPDERKEYEEKVHTVTSTILDLTAHMKERNDCIVQNTNIHTHSHSFNGSSSSIADSEELAHTNENYIKQQTEYQQELREVKQELNVKEKLHIKLIENYEKFRSLNDQEIVKSKMRDYENMISKLEKEQEELKAALRNKNGSISVKLAEDRRKRVQELEVQINDYKKKNKIQAQLLKQHEKDGEQIKKLSSEILDMKQTKVKLIKKMKSESDEFRQWKAQREKELIQLRTKERKMESEAVKKDLLHEKQRIVLQRKFEESNAANKRLKEALLKVQKNKDSKITKGAAIRSTDWLLEEIEVIMSIVDIKQSYEQLNEARAEVTSRLNKAKRQKPPNNQIIKQIQEEIEMHNAQITNLRSKINANDLEAKIKSIQDGYQSLPESRAIVKRLLNYLVENRNSFNRYFAEARDWKHNFETAEEEKKQMNDEFKRKLDEAQKEAHRLAEENAEKQSLLLKALASEGSQSEVINLLQQELNKTTAELNQFKQKRTSRKQQTTYELNDDVEFINDSDDDYASEDSKDNDPDWIKTPAQRTKKKRSVADNSADSETKMEPSNRTLKPASKRSKNGCGCKSGCTANCGCRKNGFSCTDSCGCLAHKNCTNGSLGFISDVSKRGRSTDESDMNDTEENKENNNMDEEIPCTPPKKLRIEDVMNPYIYSQKKRQPIFTSKHDI